MRLQKIIICQILAIALLAIGGLTLTAGSKSQTKRGRKRSKSLSKIEVFEQKLLYKKINHAASGLISNKQIVTTIPKSPKRIIAFGCADHLYFLGYSPVAEASSWDFYPKTNYLRPYNKSNFTGHVGGVYGSRIPNPESAMTFKPDLIVGNQFSSYHYRQLNLVAPTILLPHYKKYREELLLIDFGKILGCEDKAIRAAVWFSKKIKLVKRALEKYYPQGAKVSVLWFTSRRIRVCNKHYIYERLGLKPVVKIPWIGVHPVGSGIFYMDPEQLAKLNADHIFAVSLYDRQKFFAARIEDLTIWKSIPAVRNNSVTKVNVGHWISGGPLGRSIMLNELVNVMLKPKQISDELKIMLKDRPNEQDLQKISDAEIDELKRLLDYSCEGTSRNYKSAGGVSK